MIDIKIFKSCLVSVDDRDIIKGHFVVPDSVTSIGSNAFACCSGLTSIDIPDSVTSIDSMAFYDCSSLESIKIPNGVTRLINHTFAYCSSLTSIEIPDSVTSIGWYAFEDCSSLTSIEIPDSVTSIGRYVFYRCTSLTSKTKNYKAFEADMTCRGYKFKIGKWSEEVEDPIMCWQGYHYCTNIFDIFNYYSGKYDKDFIICECEVGDVIIEQSGNSKHVTNKIKPIRKLEWQEVLDLINIKD